MKRTTQIMDIGPNGPDDTDPERRTLVVGDAAFVLLDGKGKYLKEGLQPVFLTFTEEEVRAGLCKNSRGQLFDPQPAFPLPEIK